MLTVGIVELAFTLLLSRLPLPLVAALTAAVKYLTVVEDLDGGPLSDVDRREPIPPRRSARSAATHSVEQRRATDRLAISDRPAVTARGSLEGRAESW